MSEYDNEKILYVAGCPSIRDNGDFCPGIQNPVQWYHSESSCRYPNGSRRDWIYGNGDLYCESCGNRSCILDHSFKCSNSWHKNQYVGTDADNICSILGQIVKMERNNTWTQNFVNRLRKNLRKIAVDRDE